MTGLALLVACCYSCSLLLSSQSRNEYQDHGLTNISQDEQQMRVQYRFVNFGTRFEAAGGSRPLDSENNPANLHENEIALDVGGCCWGYDKCDLAVIDHHFERPGQFPSASVAVLHLAQWVRA